jgi:hypothetical protein
MDWATFITLVRLKHALELREEWVAVAHVSYLLDMNEPSHPDERADWQSQCKLTSFSIH